MLSPGLRLVNSGFRASRQEDSPLSWLPNLPDTPKSQMDGSQLSLQYISQNISHILRQTQNVPEVLSLLPLDPWSHQGLSRVDPYSLCTQLCEFSKPIVKWPYFFFKAKKNLNVNFFSRVLYIFLITFKKIFWRLTLIFRRPLLWRIVLI